MDTTQINYNVQLTNFVIGTPIKVAYYTLRTAYNVARAMTYVAKHHINLIRYETPYVFHIVKGGTVITAGTVDPEAVNKYHTRYDHSTRGNLGETEWDLTDGAHVKVGA